MGVTEGDFLSSDAMTTASNTSWTCKYAASNTYRVVDSEESPGGVIRTVDAVHSFTPKKSCCSNITSPVDSPIGVLAQAEELAAALIVEVVQHVPPRRSGLWESHLPCGPNVVCASSQSVSLM